MNTAVSYSIALALYDQNCVGLVPVEGPRAGQSFREVPILRCEKVVITKPDGSQVVHDPTAEAKMGHAYTVELAPYRINAKSIIAHLAVTNPDGAESKYQAPLEIYMHGARYEESIWLTDRQPDTELSYLAELIYDAYWDWHGDNSESDSEQYFSDCKILKTRILEGDETAFVAELQRLCNQFLAPESDSGGDHNRQQRPAQPDLAQNGKIRPVTGTACRQPERRTTVRRSGNRILAHKETPHENHWC